MMSADDSTVVDVSTTNTHVFSEKENMTISIPHHTVGTCFGLPYQDHNYGAPPPPTPPSCSPHLSPIHVSSIVETETVSIVTTTSSNDEVHETSITRCVCGFEHDDEYMICCDGCLVWQHVDCMGLDRSKIPETYLCEQCEPRKVDRQKAKLLQAKKKVVLPEKLIFTETSEESEEDHSNQNPDSSKGRVQRSSSRRRNEDEKELSKSEHSSLRRGKSYSKHAKERMEIKRSKFRKRTKSRTDSGCAADEEEAQDAWKCSMEWPKKRYENSHDNQYSEEIHDLTGSLRNQTDESRLGKQLQAQLCKVVDCGGHNKKLIAVCDMARDQMIIEYKGQFTSASLFHEKHPAFKHRLLPYVLFYKLRSNEELCVDATNYKTDAKYVRRSCQPNAEVHHFVVSGSLHLYILSIKDIKKDEEITIPFDINYSDCLQDAVCACNSEKCLYGSQGKIGSSDSGEKKRKGKRSHISTDDDSNQSLGVPSLSSSPSKPSKSPCTKSNTPSQKVATTSPSATLEQSCVRVISEDQDTDDQAKDHKKKLTREERKLDAIMRAFDQMEKAAKRRQQALDRMAQQKALNTQKSEDSPEKQERSTQSAKEEEKQASLSTTYVSNENTCADEEKSAGSSQTVKPKKGKRRRGSGASSRRRSRTNSGGSDVFTADEASACESSMSLLTSPSIDMSETTAVPSSEAPSSSTPQSSSPLVFPKTKRFLHHEWLQEKVESTSSSTCPLSIHTEMSYSMLATPTCYVRCTKDSPSSGGISAAHLRRSSIAGHGKQASGQGSAKKRWLRQAMYDSEPWEGDSVATDGINGAISPFHTVCCSPHGQNDIGSPGVSPLDDVITPLKKRRLMRKSVESLSSPKSPTAESTGASSGLSPDHSSCEPTADSLVDGICSTESLTNLELSSISTGINFIGKCVPTGNGLGKHLLKSLRENWIMNDNKTKADASDNSRILKDAAISNCNDSEDATEVKTAELVVNNLGDSSLSGSPERTEDSVVCKEACENASQRQIEPKNAKTVGVEQAFEKTVEDTGDCKLIASKEADNLDFPGCCSVNEGVTTPRDKCEMSKEIISCDAKLNNVCDSTSGESNVSAPVQEMETTLASLSKESCSAKVLLVSGGDSLVQNNALDAVAHFNKQLNTTVSSVEQKVENSDMQNLSVNPYLSHSSLKGENVDSVMETGNIKVAKTECVTEISNCNAQSSTHAQSGISKKCSSGNSCSSVNMLITHSDDMSHIAVSADIHVGKAKILNTEAVPTGVTRKESDSEPLKTLSIRTCGNSEDVSRSASAPCATASHRRKVSLSEYRQRKRDNPNNTQPDSSKVKNNCVFKSEVSEALCEKEIKLAALPLFEKVDLSKTKSEKTKLASGKFQKQAKEVNDSVVGQSEYLSGQRENLTERLKREFGFDDDSNSDGKKDGPKHKKPNEPTLPKISPDIAPILSLCTQLSPPPPPPPTTANPLVNTNGTTTTQFSYASAQAPYMIPQIPPNQFMATQPPLSSQPVIPIIHPAPPAMQPSCTYGATLHTSVSRPPYPAVNNQNFSSISQQTPPHIPLPPTFPSPFQPRLYK